MNPHNSANPSTTVNDPIDVLESNFKTVVEHLASHAEPRDDNASGAKANGAASITSFIAKASQAIKDYPIAAIGIAFGVGYVFMRLVRR